MAQIELWINQDLQDQDSAKVHYINGSFFSHNGNGNRINVRVTDNGAPAALSGTVSGYVLCPDGSTVPCVGALSGNVASITIPPAAYMPGTVLASVMLTDGEEVTTLAAVSANVVQTRTDNQVDPGTVVQDWTQAINAELQEVQDAANRALAVSGGALPHVVTEFESGGVNTADGTLSTMSRRIRYKRPSAPQAQAGDYIYLDPDYKCYFGLYNDQGCTDFAGMLSPGGSVLIPAGGSPEWGSGLIPLPEVAVGLYVMICIAKVGYETESINADIPSMQVRCIYVRPSLIATLEDIPAVDPTLTVPGAAAEAEATGEAIAQAAATAEKAEKWLLSVLPELGYRDFAWRIGVGLNPTSGNYTGNDSFATTEDIPVRPGAILINTTGDAGTGGRVTSLFVAWYAGDVYGGRVQVMTGEKFTVPETATKIRIMYGYSGSDRPDMTWQLLNAYFHILGLLTATQYGAWNDGERPIYCAFGASTTAGAVHHQNSDPITYAPDNWPDYLGRITGLEAHNLGVGTTGFMERGDRGDEDDPNPNYGDPDYYPNICDQIMRNDELLQSAGLITIMFGYGNDNWVGPFGNIKRFMIGSYQDYYPYDDAYYGRRSRVTHFGTAQGLTEMVMDDGATLMGCLNWCIKYINEHYPLAQLVLVFGSPSANDGREVVTVSNDAWSAQGTNQGKAPYKLTFTSDPFHDAEDHTGSEYGIYLIHTELEKLQAALDIPIIDLFYGGNAMSWYSTYAKDPDDSSKYALFSTKGTTAAPTWNSHPNDAGYKYFARHLAGRIAGLFMH